MDATQLLRFIVRPILHALHMHSISAEKILMGTCAIESDMGKFIHQNGGVARGIFQEEPATHDDVAVRYLGLHPGIKVRVIDILGTTSIPDSSEVIGNMYLATIMCRLKYWMIAEPLPAHDDLWALATYYKKYYNTEGGKATTEDFVYKFNKYCKDLWEV